MSMASINMSVGRYRAEQQRTHTAETKIDAKIGGEKKTMFQRWTMKMGSYTLRGNPRLGWLDRVRSDLKEQQIEPKLAQNRGRIHTGSGSVPDSSEPYASGRLSVGFAFTLQTTDPTRTVRVHFAVYTLRLLRDRLWPNYIYLTHDICHLSGSCESYQWK